MTGAPPRFPVAWITVALLCTLAMLSLLVLTVHQTRSSVESAASAQLDLERLRGRIARLDEVLTMSARMAAASGEPSWELRYLRHEPELEAAFARALRLDPDGGPVVQDTVTANEALVALEHRAFDLVRAGRHDQAAALLASKEYETWKLRYADGVRRMMQRIDADRERAAAQATWLGRVAWWAGLGGALWLAGVWFVTLHSLRRWRRALLDARQHLAEARAELVALNQDLASRVRARTAEAEARLAQSQDLALELSLVQRIERQRLARVLHDQLQQLLVAARFAVETAREDAVVEPHLSRASELLQQALEESRDLTLIQDPPIRFQERLGPALRWLGGWFGRRHDLDVQVLGSEQSDPLSVNGRRIVFEAVKELLFNVVKHAGVNRATVAITCSDQELCVQVTDDGVGFRANLDRDENQVGLRSVLRRIQLLGGEVDIDTTPGVGSRVLIRILTGPASQPSTASPAPPEPRPSARPSPSTAPVRRDPLPGRSSRPLSPTS